MVAFAAAVVVHLVLSLFLRFHLIPEAERLRRRQLLSDSFAVPLTAEQTQGYYNNELAPSMARLAASILENAFFAKRICARMASRERVKVLCYLVVWLVAALLRDTPLGLLVVLTETVFSGEVITRLVSLEVLRKSNADIFDDLYKEFLHGIEFGAPAGTACVLDAFASYEAAKASAALKQSTPIFEQLNPQLSDEWIRMRQELGMNRYGGSTIGFRGDAG